MTAVSNARHLSRLDALWAAVRIPEEDETEEEPGAYAELRAALSAAWAGVARRRHARPCQ